MSKTVEEVGLIVGGIGLALAAGPIGGALFLNLSTVNTIIGIGLSAAVAGIALALTPTAVSIVNGQLNLTEPVSFWRVIYGTFQCGGILTFAYMPTPPAQGGGPSYSYEDLHLVYTIACHKIQQFNNVLLDGIQYVIGTDLVYNGVTGYYEPTASSSHWVFGGVAIIGFEFDVGDPTNTSQPFPQLAAVTGCPWTSACLQRGRAKVHVRLRYNEAIRIYVASNPNTLFPLANGRLPNIQFNVIGKPVVDTRLGGADAWQANTLYETGQIIIDSANHKQQATTSFTSGSTIPTFNNSGGNTADGGDPTAWSDLGLISPPYSNPALCIYDYLTNTSYGMKVDPTSIDIDTVNAAASICEDDSYLVEIASGGGTIFEQRYTCNGMFECSATYGQVLKSLLTSMAGWAVAPGDAWRIYAGAYNAPSVTLTDDDLRDSIKGDFRISRRDVCNGVKGTFFPTNVPFASTSPLAHMPNPTYQRTDFPPYQGNGLNGHPNYIAEDGGAITWKDVNFDFTTSLWTCQRLAKIILQQLRFQVTLTLPCKLSAYRVQAGDTVTFNHARWNGLAPTIYFVQEVHLVMDTKGNEPTLGVDLLLRETDPTVYSFGAPQSPSNQGEYSLYGSTGQE